MDWRNKEWYDLIQRFANAQNLMGVKKTLRIKQKLFGDIPKINHLSVQELGRLLNKLTIVYYEEKNK